MRNAHLSAQRSSQVLELPVQAPRRSSQWPEPLITTPSTFSATRRPWVIRNSPEAFSPGQHQHRHLQFGPGEAGEVLGVLLEGAEHLEACPHGAGLRIGCRIELPVGLGNRAGGIGREVVPEMLEVDALPTVDERQRRLAVEVEMPQVPQQPDACPIAHAGKKRVHQHDAVDFGRILGGIGVGHHQPDIVADNADRLRAQRGRQGVDVLAMRLLS